MKLKEIQQGRAYAYNPSTIRLLDDETVRVVAIRVGIEFKVESWRGVVSHTGVRIRLPDGSTTNIEARRLLAPWAACLAYRKNHSDKERAQAQRRREHAQLCKKLQKALRARTGVEVVVDTGWSGGGFEIHMTKERGERQNDDVAQRSARKFVMAIA